MAASQTTRAETIANIEEDMSMQVEPDTQVQDVEDSTLGSSTGVEVEGQTDQRLVKDIVKRIAGPLKDIQGCSHYVGNLEANIELRTMYLDEDLHEALRQIVNALSVYNSAVTMVVKQNNKH